MFYVFLDRTRGRSSLCRIDVLYLLCGEQRRKVTPTIFQCCILSSTLLYSTPVQRALLINSCANEDKGEQHMWNDQLATFTDRREAIALFNSLRGRDPDQPWPLLPILAFVAPGGSGKSLLLRYLRE